jgi:putative cardiolipin synthase
MMRRIAALLAVLFLGALSGCAGVSSECGFLAGGTACRLPYLTQRADASDAAAIQFFGKTATTDYERRFLALLAHDRVDALDRANGTGPFGHERRSVANAAFQRAYSTLKRLAAPVEAPHQTPPRGNPGTGHFLDRWRVSRQTLYLDAAARPTQPKTFSFSGLQARSVEIVLAQIGKDSVTIGGRCDGALTLRRADRTESFAAGRPFSLRLPAGAANATLAPGPALDRCDLTIRSRLAPSGAPLTILREEKAKPALAELDSLYERCPVPDPTRLDPLQRAFYAGRWLSQTCTMPLGTPRLLRERHDGFNAKVEALLGEPLPDAAIDRADPEMPLDFSRAPRLRLIYLSSLEFKADFSGRIMERLIRYHAARGTSVRIMVTDVLERRKDDAMLHRLAAEYPNVQLQEFRWSADHGAPIDEQISQLHKTHHVKMLATLAENPARSRAVIGGRNIHDGFLFHRPVDLSRWPALEQYGKTDGFSLNYYSNWSDFDIEITDPAAVQTLAAHLSTLWLRDADSNIARPFSIPAASGARLPVGNARHFISVPYADNRALEDDYVELIDAARTHIEIANPYLNLTPKLTDAFDRALARGVRIDIVGRIDLKGDIGGKFLTALNTLFVEKYGDRIHIREFKAPDVVLHAKIMMIDGRLATVSSVNLNNRSFFHDSENGIVVLDAGFCRRLKGVYDYYALHSRPVSSNVSVPLGYRLFFDNNWIREAF